MKKMFWGSTGRMRWVTLILFVCIFGAIGTALLLRSRAASPFASVEVELASLKNGASIGADSAASGGQFLNLGTPETKPSGKCGLTEKLVPTCGALLGGWSNDYGAAGWKNQMLEHEARLGRTMDIVHHYHAPNSPPLGNNTTGNDERMFVNRANTILLVNWKPANPWKEGDGRNASVNQYIDQAADNIKSVAPKKVMLVIYHEPENDVSAGGAPSCGSNNYASGANRGTTAEYRAMWRNTRQRFDAKGVKNVVWVMNYMGFERYDCMVKDLWPGNDLVDWVMWDPYPWTDYEHDIGRFYNFLNNTSDANHAFSSKPYGFGEWGSWHDTQAETYKMYDDARKALQSNKFPNLKAYVIFDAVGIRDARIKYAGTSGNVDDEEQRRYVAFANDPLLKQPHVAVGGSAPVPAGSATITLDVPLQGNYRIWTRMKAAGDSNAYRLSMNGGSPVVVGNKSAVQDWTWIDYRDANTSAKIDVNLTPGKHTFNLQAIEPNVYIDRVIATTDKACVPTGNGSNCTTTATPVGDAVVIYKPANGSTIDGELVVNTTTREDVKKVEFLVDGNLRKTDTTYDFAYRWDTLAEKNGQHSLAAKAYDTTGKLLQETTHTVKVENAVEVDRKPPTVSLSTPTANQTLSGTVRLAAAASDNIGVTKVEFRHGTTLISSDASAPYEHNWDTTKVENGQYVVSAVALDAAGNQSAASVAISVKNEQPDTLKPVAPASLRASSTAHNQVSLTWRAATDNSGTVALYGIYRNDKLLAITAGKDTTYVDKTVSPSTEYSYYVVAADAANNVSDASNKLQLKIPASPDTKAPTASKLSRLAAGNKVFLNWTESTDEDSDIALYIVYRDGAGITATPADVTSFSDKNLQAGAEHAYYVRAVDTAGNISPISNQIEVNVSEDPDIDPPTAPGKLTAYPGILGWQINLRWEASADDRGIGAYFIFRNGEFIGATKGTSFGDANAEPGVEYTYVVVAIDTSWNGGESSNAATAKINR